MVNKQLVKEIDRFFRPTPHEVATQEFTNAFERARCLYLADLERRAAAARWLSADEFLKTSDMLQLFTVKKK